MNTSFQRAYYHPQRQLLRMHKICNYLFTKKSVFCVVEILIIISFFTRTVSGQIITNDGIGFQTTGFSVKLETEFLKISNNLGEMSEKFEGKKTVIQSKNRKYYAFLSYKISSLKGINFIYYITVNEFGKKLFSDSISFYGDLSHPLFVMSDLGELCWAFPYDGKGGIHSISGKETITFFTNLEPILERKLFIANENDILSLAVTNQPQSAEESFGNVRLTTFSLQNKRKSEYSLLLKNIYSFQMTDGIIIANATGVSPHSVDYGTFSISEKGEVKKVLDGFSLIFHPEPSTVCMINNEKLFRYTKKLEFLNTSEVALTSVPVSLYAYSDKCVLLSRQGTRLNAEVFSLNNGRLLKEMPQRELPVNFINGSVVTNEGLYLFGDDRTILVKQK